MSQDQQEVKACSCPNRQNGRHDEMCEARKGTHVELRLSQRFSPSCLCPGRSVNVHHPSCQLGEQGTGAPLNQDSFLGPDDPRYGDNESWNPATRVGVEARQDE